VVATSINRETSIERMPPRKKQKTNESTVDEPRDDGHRGLNGCDGRWISLQEAQKDSAGHEEWWTLKDLTGRAVSPIQHVRGVPAQKPVWKYANGDMYLGGWKEEGPQGHPVEEGFGIMYNDSPVKCEGLMYIGQWKNGYNHGKGESFWLESSKTWQNDHFSGSQLKRYSAISGRARGIPFRYVGSYKNDAKHDPHAKVILKDGTTLMGGWTNGKPDRDWYNEPFEPINDDEDISGLPVATATSTIAKLEDSATRCDSNSSSSPCRGVPVSPSVRQSPRQQELAPSGKASQSHPRHPSPSFAPIEGHREEVAPERYDSCYSCRQHQGYRYFK
jgi:hypothetical protein